MSFTNTTTTTTTTTRRGKQFEALVPVAQISRGQIGRLITGFKAIREGAGARMFIRFDEEKRVVTIASTNKSAVADAVTKVEKKVAELTSLRPRASRQKRQQSQDAPRSGLAVLRKTALEAALDAALAATPNAKFAPSKTPKTPKKAPSESEWTTVGKAPAAPKKKKQPRFKAAGAWGNAPSTIRSAAPAPVERDPNEKPEVTAAERAQAIIPIIAGRATLAAMPEPLHEDPEDLFEEPYEEPALDAWDEEF